MEYNQEQIKQTNNIVKLRSKLQTIKLSTTFLKAFLLYRTVLHNP